MKNKVILVVIALALSASAFLMLRSHNKPEEGFMALSGNIEATEVNVGFTLAGRVEQLFADEGRKVVRGEKLAILENAELQSLMQQRRAYMAEVKSRLEELKAGPRAQEVGQARAGVSYAEAELSKAAKDYQRAEALFKKDVISAQLMDAAKKAHDTAVSAHQKALEALSLVKEGARREELMAAESRLQQASSALRASEDRLRETTLYSPVSGVVIRKNIEPGETIAPGVPVFTIGELDKPWVKVYVKEDRLGLVRLGQQAKVSVDSYPGRVFDGIVTYISSSAEFTPKNVQTQEERVKLVFGVKVSVSNVNDELKPGMPADVKLVLK